MIYEELLENVWMEKQNCTVPDLVFKVRFVNGSSKMAFYTPVPRRPLFHYSSVLFHSYVPGHFTYLHMLIQLNQNPCNAFPKKKKNPISTFIVEPASQLAVLVAYLLALPKRPQDAELSTQ